MKRDLNDFLGVHIERRKDGTIKMSQPRTENQILKELRYGNKHLKGEKTPDTAMILKRHEDMENFDNSFNYRSIIGKIGYLENAKKLELA